MSVAMREEACGRRRPNRYMAKGYIRSGNISAVRRRPKKPAITSAKTSQVSPKCLLDGFKTDTESTITTQPSVRSSAIFFAL